MRVAPIGLVAADPFNLACEAAALTHGHPSGYLAAGTFAAVLAGVIHGRSLGSSIDQAVELLRSRPGHEETLQAVEGAVELAASGGQPSPETVEALGGGWVAEEALAIALYCALVAADFRHAVLLAVNHSGDSDSTGSMVGNLLGAALGLEALPQEWLQGLQARSLVEQVARDLATIVGEDAEVGDPERYPGW
jgi:ADP-ribosylglycohydrolase